MPVQTLSKAIKSYQDALEDYRDRQVLTIPEQHREQWLKGFATSREYATVIPRNEWFDKGVRAGHGFGKIYRESHD